MSGAGSYRTFDPVSGEALTDEAGVPTPEDAASEADRYELGGLLGRGGMGEVRVARDTRLGRDVAIKTARPHGPDQARLAREAAMTARLEHPSIMPVYDAGTDDEGLPYYTMRLLPGRSLAAVLAERPSGPARLRLVRHLVDAAEAIAYAHGRGVLHRDLKPANVMVGAFGETVVADWGLACTLEEGARPRAGGAGTPGYMSPEQARGAPLDERTDVYGLGAMLHELLAGTPPTDRPDAAPSVRPRAPVAPPALAAIADRALRADPAERYPSARAFADDLLAWYEGRRVTAHAYSVRELLALVVAAWRVPLLVATAGLTALAVAVGVGWRSTAVEQERAVASEGAAVAARRAEAAALGRALVAQARTAARDGRALEAEVLAANALLRVESPEARGVLARFARSPRFALIRAGAPLPTCRTRSLTRDGERLVCLTDTEALLLDATTGEVLARAAGGYNYAGFALPDRLLLVDTTGGWDWAPPAPPRLLTGLELLYPLFGTSEVAGKIVAAQGSSDLVLDLAAGTLHRGRACGPDRVSATAALRADGTLLVGCDDRRIVRGAPGEVGTTFAQLSADEGPPQIVEPHGDGALVATARGWVIALGPAGERRAVRRLGADAARRLRVGGPLVAIAAQDGAVHLWEHVSDTLIASLHAPGAELAWRPDGRLRVLTERAEDREVPAGPSSHFVAFGAGVAGLAFDPAGARLAVGVGDGSVHVVDIETTRVVRTWGWQEQVAKDVAWSPDGRLLAVATAGGSEQRVLDVASGSVAAMLPGVTARRVAWTTAGLLFASYRDDLRLWAAPWTDRGETLAERQIVDLELAGDAGAALDRAGGVYLVSGGPRPTFTPVTTHARASAVARIGDDVLVGTPTSLTRYHASGTSLGERAVPGGVSDLAVSADRRLVAVGHLDGTAAIWPASGTAPLATLEGHGGRVSAVAFSPDGRTLATGGWDETVRLWSTAGLEDPADAIVARVESAWGRDLDAVLAAPQ
ncbi:MAG: serine/threonine-protein kinase [Pseudomonadota bacterium]|nr:serine/threonine-protein kinase [Pseudomonadota bacterium]